jgi:hypothetical protein
MSNRRIALGGVAQPLLIVFIALAGLGVTARPAHAGTITVGWDLMTATNVTGYRVFVGTRSGTYDQSFDVDGDREFFIFRNAFMGVRYFFAVAALFDDGTVSGYSNEVSSVGTRTVAGDTGAVAVPDPVSGSATCARDCFVVSDLATGLGGVTSLAAAADGSVFVVEDGRRILLLRGGSATTVFEAERNTSLRDIALDSQFDSTGRVFVSLLRARDRVTGDVEVLRLRYLAGALGEPATIVSALSVPLGASVPFTLGGDALVYLAVPALPARHPYSGSVVAFDQDGRVPEGQRSAVVARGFDEPADLAWDAQTRAVWLVGRTAGSEAQMLAVSRAAATATAVPNVVTAGEEATAVAVASGSVRRLLVAAGVDLIESVPGGSDTRRISLEGYGTPVAVASAGGVRYAATGNGDRGGFRVVRVDEGSAPAAR